MYEYDDAPSNYLTDETRDELAAEIEAETCTHSVTTTAGYCDSCGEEIAIDSETGKRYGGTVGHIHMCSSAGTHGYGDVDGFSKADGTDGDGYCVCTCGARKYWLANYAAWTLA